VQVHHDEGIANRIGPEPCAGDAAQRHKRNQFLCRKHTSCRRIWPGREGAPRRTGAATDSTGTLRRYASSRLIKTLGNVRLGPIGTPIGPIVSKPDAP
jgi:hypothetical protein